MTLETGIRIWAGSEKSVGKSDFRREQKKKNDENENIDKNMIKI